MFRGEQLLSFLRRLSLFVASGPIRVFRVFRGLSAVTTTDHTDHTKALNTKIAKLAKDGSPVRVVGGNGWIGGSTGARRLDKIREIRILWA